MTTRFDRFKSFARAATAALVLGSAALLAAPAQAQPSFSFELQIPGQGGGAQFGTPGDGFGTQHDRGRWNDDYEDDYGYEYRCLTDREIRRGIADYGFHRVEIWRELPRQRVEVRAIYGNWLYSMRVDRCTGEVDRVQRLNRRGGGYPYEGF